MKRYLVLMLVVFCSIASTCLAQQENAMVGADKTLLHQHDKALSEQNVKGIMETYSSSPDIILMGTGPGEVYVGKEGVEAAYSQFFTRFEPGSVSFEYEWISADSSGDVAWFGATITGPASVKGEKKHFAFNMSGTMKKEEGKWRLVLLHFSRLGAEDQPETQKSQ